MKPLSEPAATRRLVGYCRVSSKRQAEEGLSIPVQEGKLRRYAELYEVDLVAVYMDKGKSGGKTTRPGLRRALRALEDGHADTLVVVKLDRLTRSILHLGQLLRDYFGPRASFEFIALEDSVDTSTASGKMLANLLITIAEWERDIAYERTMAIREVKQQAGEFLGGDPPYGWRVRVARKGEEDQVKRIEKVSKEQEVIVEILALRENDYSLGRIAEELNVRGWGKRRRNKKPWTRQAVSRVLQGAKHA